MSRVLLAAMSLLLMAATGAARDVVIENDWNHTLSVYYWSFDTQEWADGIRIRSGDSVHLTVDSTGPVFLVAHQAGEDDNPIGWVDFTTGEYSSEQGDLAIVHETRTREVYYTVRLWVYETQTIFRHGREVTRTVRKPVYETRSRTVEFDAAVLVFRPVVGPQIEVAILDLGVDPPPRRKRETPRPPA